MSKHLTGNRISEDRLQQEIFTYHWNNYPEERGLLFMVHNNPRNRIEGAQLKAKGLVAGVSDMIYLAPMPRLPFLLELKTLSGKQSPEQKAWQTLTYKAGYYYAIVRTLEEAKKICGWDR